MKEYSLEEIGKIAERVANTKFFKSSAKGDERIHEAFTIAMLGYGLGLDPVASFQAIYIIEQKEDGKIVGKTLAFTVQALLAIASRNGLDLQVPNPAEVKDSATVIARRWLPDGTWSAPQSFTFTMKMAEEQGLLNKYNWRKLRPFMLIARAVAIAIRSVGGFMLGAGAYLLEELSPDTRVSETGTPLLTDDKDDDGDKEPEKSNDENNSRKIVDGNFKKSAEKKEPDQDESEAARIAFGKFIREKFAPSLEKPMAAAQNTLKLNGINIKEYSFDSHNRMIEILKANMEFRNAIVSIVAENSDVITEEDAAKFFEDNSVNIWGVSNKKDADKFADMLRTKIAELRVAREQISKIADDEEAIIEDFDFGDDDAVAAAKDLLDEYFDEDEEYEEETGKGFTG